MPTTGAILISLIEKPTIIYKTERFHLNSGKIYKKSIHLHVETRILLDEVSVLHNKNIRSKLKKN